MQNKQSEAFGYAYCLESRGFEAEATLLRTQHEAIERKDALLKQALDAMQQCFDHDRFSPSVKAMQAIAKELSQ